MKISSQPAALSIGVIIPIFNSGREAVGAIRSVINQAEVCINEIIIVDDGSTDNSSNILRENFKDLGLPLRILSVTNGGAANARNYGMQNCDCDLYAFLDSDDAWFSNKLKHQLPLFEDPSVGMVGCLTTMGQRAAFPSGISLASRTITLRQQLFKNYFQTSTVILRRQVVEAVGLFPINQRHAEEGDLFNRIAAHYKCILLSEILVNYGNGKQGFGDSGLSADLFAMERGELLNIRRAYMRGDCDFRFQILAIAYSLIKFLRRFLISSIRRKNRI